MKWIAVIFPHFFQGNAIFFHGIRIVKNSFVKVLIVIVYLALYNHLETCNAPYHYADNLQQSGNGSNHVTSKFHDTFLTSSIPVHSRGLDLYDLLMSLPT